jgi:7-cyano-7-deazaguanine synthase
VFVRTHFPTPPRIAELYRSVARQVHVGEQYRWLAAIAEAQRWSGVELSMTRFENAPPLQALIFGDDGVLRQTEEAELFRYWSFPLLHVAKEQMARTAERHGFLDVLSQRWFCFTPVLDKPCGYCRPCRLAYREEVDFAHPALAWAARNVRRGRRLSRTDVRDKLRERLGRAVDSAAARR